MIYITELKETEHINLGMVDLSRYNRIWGLDYMLMDSSTFMGGDEGSKYENIIEMLVNIRNLNGSQQVIN